MSVRVLMAAIAIFPMSLEALGQGYPARPVRVIVPSSAGGGVDLIARLIGQNLAEKWKQPFIVDTRPGATGIIGTDIVAKAVPDGHTLLFAWTAPLSINPGLYEKLPYDVQRDFAPIILAASTPNVIVVRPSGAIRSVKDLVESAQRLPGKLSYGSSGVGGSSHLAGELFASMAGVNMVHIPYKSTSPALVDLIAGRIDLMFAAVAPAMPHIRAGRLRAVAVTIGKRSQILPELPTAAESVPGFEADTWYGLLAPAGTPGAIVQRLNKETNAFLLEPGTAAALNQQGFEALGGTSAEFGRFLVADIEKWRKLIKRVGIRAD